MLNQYFLLFWDKVPERHQMLPTKWENLKDFLFFFGNPPLGILIWLSLITLIYFERRQLTKETGIDHMLFPEHNYFSFFKSEHNVWRDHKKKSLTFKNANCLVFHFNSGKTVKAQVSLSSKRCYPHPLPPWTPQSPGLGRGVFYKSFVVLRTSTSLLKHHGQMPGRPWSWLPRVSNSKCR